MEHHAYSKHLEAVKGLPEFELADSSFFKQPFLSTPYLADSVFAPEKHMKRQVINNMHHERVETTN